MKTEHRGLATPGIGDCVERFSQELCVSLHRDYFAEDDGDMAPRRSPAAGKEAVCLVLLNSLFPAGHRCLESWAL